MKSNVYGVITNPNHTQELMIESINGVTEDLYAAYLLDPTDYLDAIITINGLVAGGKDLEVLVVDKTQTLPLGFHFYILVQGSPNSYIEAVFRDNAGRYHYANDQGGAYFEPVALLYNTLWQVILVENPTNQRREWFFSLVNEYDRCQGENH